MRFAARERSKAWFPPRREETSLHACKAIPLTLLTPMVFPTMPHPVRFLMIHSVIFRSSKPSSLYPRLLLLLVLAGLLPAPARAQVNFTGASPSVNFGSQAIGTPSAAQTLNFSIESGTTVGSIGVLTQGAANLDFANAEGSTCTAMTYTSAATCTVNVTFTPRVAGTRMGAVVFFSEAGDTGTVLANVPVYGVGTGPQIAYGPGNATVIDSTVNGKGLDEPISLAVDGAGDLFIADWVNSRVVEVPAGSGTPIVIAPTVNSLALNSPGGLAIDGAGDLFIADTRNIRVVVVPVGGGAAFAISPTVNSHTLDWPFGMALDGAGDLFIADNYNSRVVEVPLAGGAAAAIDPEVSGVGLEAPAGVALDSVGDLFIADFGRGRVVEVPAGGGAAIAIDPTVNGEGLYEPQGVALDSSGDLFIADFLHSRVVEVPAGGGATIAIDPTVNGLALSYTESVAVDGAGDLFIADSYHNRVVSLQHSQPPAFHFPTTTPDGSTDTTDGTHTVQIQNIGNEPLIFTAISYPADFSEAAGDANACTSSTSLSPGQKCDLPIHFTPQNGGFLSESVTLTDNALGVTGAQQLIGVSGTGKPGSTPQTIIFPNPGSQLALTSVGLTATASSGSTVSYASTTPTVCTVSGATASSLISGACTIEATQAGNAVYAAASPVYSSFWVNHATQTIAFPAISTPQIALTGVPLTATASSGLAVIYVSTTPTYCTVSSSIATPILASGTCTIEATQAGNGAYGPATPVSHSFWVNHASQTIAFPAIAPQPALTSVSLTATASSGLAVSYVSTTPAYCTVSGSTVMPILASGTCTIEATQAGNAAYAAATPVYRGFWVNHAAQTITFPFIANHVVLTSATLAATASSGLAVSYTSLTPSVCSVSGATASLPFSGICTIQATQAGNTVYGPAPAINRSFTVTGSTPQTITFPPIATEVALTSVGLSATASSGLTVSYISTTSTICSVSGATASSLTSGMCGIAATQTGNGIYSAAATVYSSFWVNHATQTITFPAIATPQVAATSVGLTATASSGLTVAYASTTPTICGVSGATASSLISGICTIQATQAGNGVYAAASAVSRAFWINHATQTITFPAIATPQVALTSVNLTATVSSGLAVSYVSTTPTYCMVSGSTVMPILASGTCTIEAIQPGSGAYGPATPISHSFWVNHATQTITFPTIPTQTGVSSLSLSATASSGLTVSFASVTPTVCTVSGTTTSLLSNGTCGIQATQAGNAVYGPAPQITVGFTVTSP
jgi:sugar lactone lactonase YvrE